MSEISKFKISKGFDVNLSGKPVQEITDLKQGSTVIVYPKDYKGIKPKLLVKEGEQVKKGGLLFEDKKNNKLKFTSPAGGLIKSIIRGERRSLEQIVIEVASEEDVENFKPHNCKSILKLKRQEVVDQLFATGYIALMQERPFSKIPSYEVTPKAIFVNGMTPSSFQPSASVVVKGDEDAFQAGLNVLNTLTSGDVHLCLSLEEYNNGMLSEALTKAENSKVHYFGGPHPSGNSSIHIDNIDPFNTGDFIWTVKAVDLILIGKLFLNGELPTHKVISVGGDGIKEEGQKYYKARIGASLEGAVKDQLVHEANSRIIEGDVLSGTQISTERHLSLKANGITVIPESSERHFLGWLSPGLNKISLSRTHLSTIFGGKKKWSLNTNLNGSLRALVTTGWYNKVMPMDIMVDFLVKAVLAHDTEEAIKLGILETDPEDYALCTFLCPSKVEVQSIIQQGLDEIEAEGL